MAAAKPISSLAAALAQAPNNISKSRDAGHPANLSHSLPPKHRGGLPTPPNSLSPTLPPQNGRSPSISANMLHPIESDFDLHESSHGHQLLSSAALSGIDATGAITATLLAKHHLPDILLKEGPLAIRVVLAHLTQKVPGFSGIPPAKARRLVVAALENRSGGGLKGDVVFEKVGWGRWDARYRHQPPRESTGTEPDGPHYATSAPSNLITSSYGTRQRTGHLKRSRYPGSPLLSPFDDHDHISEDEADKMSLDGEEHIRPSRRPIPIIEAPDDDEMTDEEDWAGLGFRGMMAASYEPSSFGSRRGSRMSSLAAPSLKSATLINPPQNHRTPSIELMRSMSYSAGIIPFQRVYSSSLSSALRMQGAKAFGSIEEQQQTCGSPQEREAVEALLKMGSM